MTAPITDYSKVILLLPMSGVDNGQDFPDLGPYKFGATPFGGAKTVTSASKYYGSSGYFNGSQDRLKVSLARPIGTGDFRIRFWINRAGNGPAGPNAAEQVIDMRSTEPSESILLYINGSSMANPLKMEFWVNGAARIRSNAQITAGWKKVELVRESGVTKLFIDDVQEGSSYSDSHNYASLSATVSGRFADISGNYRGINGYLQDLAIFEGASAISGAQLATTISGNATTQDGSPVGKVRIFGWPGSPLIGTAEPDGGGVWSATIANTPFGVTYIADGFKPITHGPYTAGEG